MPKPEKSFLESRYNFSGTDNFVRDFFNKYVGKQPNREDFVQVYRRHGTDPNNIVKGLYQSYAPDKLSDDRVNKLKKDYKMDPKEESAFGQILRQRPTYRQYATPKEQLPTVTRKQILDDKAQEYINKQYKNAYKSDVIEEKTTDQIFREVEDWYGKRGAINPYESMYRFQEGTKNLKEQYESLINEQKENYEQQANMAEDEQELKEIQKNYRDEIERLQEEYRNKKQELAYELNLNIEEKQLEGEDGEEPRKVKRAVIPKNAFKTFQQAQNESARKVLRAKEQRSKPGFGKSLFANLAINMKDDILELPEAVLASSEYVHNQVMNVVDEVTQKTGKNPDQINLEDVKNSSYWTDIYETNNQENQKLREQYKYYDKNISDYLQAGDFGKAAGALLIGTTKALPSVTKIAAMSSIGMPMTGLSAMGIQKGGERLLDLRDRDDLEWWQKLSNAVTWGMNEIVAERFGTYSILKNVRKRLAKQGVEATQKSISKAMQPWLNRTAQRVVRYGQAPFREGLEEWSVSIADDLSTKMTVDPDIKVGENAFDEFLVGMAVGGGMSMPADIKSVYQDVAGDTQQKYIRRKLKKIPKEYEAGSKIDVLQLEMQKDVLEMKRRELDPNLTTNIDQQIENIDQKISNIHDRETNRVESEEMSTADLIDQQLQRVENDLINEDYQGASQNMIIDGTKLDQIIQESKGEMDQQTFEELRKRNNELSRSIDKIKQEDYANIPNENIRNAFQRKQREPDQPVQRPRTEDLVPQEIQDYAVEQGYNNIHEALNSVRKHVNKEIGPEDLTKEYVDEAISKRTKQKQVKETTPTETVKEETQPVEETTPEQQKETTALEQELENPEVDIETYIEANPRLTEYGEELARKREENKTIGKSQARGAFKYFRGEIGPRELLSEEYGHGGMYHENISDQEAEQYAKERAEPYRQLYNDILARNTTERTEQQQKATAELGEETQASAAMSRRMKSPQETTFTRPIQRGEENVGDITYEKGDNQWSVKRIDVEEAQQRQGYGTKAYRDLARQAEQEGATLYSDRADKINDNARALWESFVERGEAVREGERYRMLSPQEMETQQETAPKKTAGVEPSKKLKSNIQKFIDDYRGDQNVADPSVKTARKRAEKYMNEHGDWLYQNDKGTYDALMGFIEESKSEYDGGYYDTLKERDKEAGTGTQQQQKVERDAQQIQQIPEEVTEAAKEAGYKSTEDFWIDYKNFGTYQGVPKASDLVEADVQSVISKKQQRQKAPKKEKTQKEKPKNIADNIESVLRQLEDGVIKGTITSLKEAPKIEGKSIGQYLIDNKGQLTTEQYERLRNRNNSISRSITAIRQGQMDDIPNARIKRGMKGNLRERQQAETKMPKTTKDFLRYTISRLQERMPGINITYDNTLDQPAKFTEGGIIVNPDRAGTDTAIHEYAHPYIQLLKNENKELWSTGAALMREAGIAEEMRQGMTQGRRETDEAFEERVADEAMAKIIGEQGARIAQKKYNRKTFAKIRDLAERFWNWVKEQLGILPRYDVSTLTVDQFGKLVARDLFNTQPLTKENSQNIIEADITGDYGNISLDNGALLFSRQGKTNMDKLIGWLARYFRTKAQAPDIAKKLEQAKLGEVRRWTQDLRLNIMDFHNYLRKNYMKTKSDPNNPFNGMTKEEIGERLNGIMQENLPLYDQELEGAQRQAEQFRILQKYGFPEDADLLQKILNMRGVIDRLSQELITSGLIEGRLAGVVNANLGVYLTRTFQAHKNKNWEPSLDVRKRARRTIRAQHQNAEVEGFEYKKNDDGTLNLTLNTLFSGNINFKNIPVQDAMDLLEYTKADNPFDKNKGSETMQTPIAVGWKTDKEGQYVNRRLDKLDDDSIDRMLDQLIDSDVQEAMFRGKGKGFSKAPFSGILMKRKAIPDDILEFMGVEKDAYVRMYDSVKKMANLLATHKSLESLKNYGMGKFLWRKSDAPSGTEQISALDNESYSPLNGLYAKKETINYLKKVDDPKNINWAMKSIMKFNGIVKGGFTIWNNVTQLRNMLSWSAIHAANGTFDLREVDEYAKIALQDMGWFRSNQEAKNWHKKLIELHVLHENADFNDFQDFIMEQENKPERYFTDSWISKVGKVGQTIEKARKAGRATERFAEQLYRFGDDINKTIYFFNTLKTYEKAHPEMSKEDLYKRVADITIRTTPTYSDLPAAVRMLRRFPVTGAFVSWPTAMVKSSVGSFRVAMEEINSGNQVLKDKGYKRLFGSMLFSTPIAGLMTQLTSQLLAGIDDDEVKKLEPFLAPWNQNTYKLFLPSAEEGTYRFVPISYVDPYNYSNRIITALLRSPGEGHKPVVEAMKEFFKPYVGQDVVFKVVGDIFSDIKSGKGKIVNPADDIYGQTLDILDHTITELSPGVVKNISRISKAFSEQKDLTEYGTRYRAFNEIFTNLTGFRVTETDVRKSLFYKTNEYHETINDIRRAYRQAKYDPQLSDETVTNEFYTQNKKAREEFARMKDMIYSTKAQLGLEDKEILKVMRDVELPEWMIKDLVTGQFSGIYKNPSEKLKEDLKERRK